MTHFEWYAFIVPMSQVCFPSAALIAVQSGPSAVGLLNYWKKMTPLR
tara:strand:+ start:425 stop:565 length:141 start_codon:yes stop_codon:yes gene_type:complete